MSGATKITTYELYTLERSGWVLHSRYTGAEMDDATADAKGIETNLNHATKLIRETYYPDSNHSDEAVVRISPNLAEYKRRLQRPQGPRVGSGGPDFAFGWNNGEDKEETSTGVLLARITMMVGSALLIAATVTGVLALLLRTPAVASHLSPSTPPRILFGSFITVFLLSALPLVSRYIPALTAPKKTEKTSKTAFLDMPGGKSGTPATKGPALFQNDPGLMERKPEPEKQPEAPKPEKKPDPEPKKKPEPEPEPEPEKKPDPEPEKKPEPEPESKPEAEDAAKEEEDATRINRQRMTMMRFLTGAITALKDACPHLDAYNKFGLNLIMAGVCSALGRRESLSPAQVTAMTREAACMLGSKPSLADAFCRKLETHVADPRYALMYQHGEAALEDYLSGTGSPFEDLREAMGAWNRPADRISGTDIVTILFTDMVGSTQLTQNRGDTAAQDYVRAHNTIVRTALAAHQGLEVKHTGDGIMASFGAPSQAIECAAAIQKGVRTHNEEHPDRTFLLRIGINAGEPIVEDDDLFGAAVQLAARICSEADPAHILISNVMRELVAGKTYPMEKLPPRLLRGVQEAQILFDVDWNAMGEAETPPTPAAAAVAALLTVPAAPAAPETAEPEAAETAPQPPQTPPGAAKA